MNSFDADEVEAIAEMKAQENAMAEAEKKNAKPSSLITQTPVPVVQQAQMQFTIPTPPINNLSRFVQSVVNGQKISKMHVYPQPNYRLRRIFFERLGSPRGLLVRCPTSEHGYHQLDEGVMGIVILDTKNKHADLPPLSGLSIEARDYIQSLTLRSDLRVHMYTNGYVVYEDKGTVLTVEIKD